MTTIDMDLPRVINMLDISVARLKQSRGESTPRRAAAKYVDEVIKDLDKWSDWFREQLVNTHD